MLVYWSGLRQVQGIYDYSAYLIEVEYLGGTREYQSRMCAQRFGAGWSATPDFENDGRDSDSTALILRMTGGIQTARL